MICSPGTALACCCSSARRSSISASPGTSVSNAGFLTALYVPLVPILVLLVGGKLDALSSGNLWVIASTVLWAAHVLWVGRIAACKCTPILVVCGALASGLAWVQEPVTAAGLSAALPSILYGGLLSVGIGFTLQVVA